MEFYACQIIGILCWIFSGKSQLSVIPSLGVVISPQSGLKLVEQRLFLFLVSSSYPLQLSLFLFIRDKCQNYEISVFHICLVISVMFAIYHYIGIWTINKGVQIISCKSYACYILQFIFVRLPNKLLLKSCIQLFLNYYFISCCFKYKSSLLDLKYLYQCYNYQLKCKIDHRKS